MKANKSNKPDSDMENATKALIRAAKRARVLAAQTGTRIVVVRDGKLVREVPPLEQTKKTTKRKTGETP